MGDEQRSEISTDKNGESLVLLYEEKGFSALFTGDIGEEQEKQILKWGGINDIDFYKAAHHGSKYSNTKSFLDAVSPRISVISCAERIDTDIRAGRRLKISGIRGVHCFTRWRVDRSQ